MKIENDEVREREIEELKSQIDALRTSKIKLQIRQNQLRVLNDKDEDRIEELQNLILEKEIELELERSNNQNSITQRTEIEKKSKDLSKQIDFLKRQVSTLQMSEEESKRQKEQLYQKITEQNKKITKLNHLFQNKETELQQVQQKNNNVVAEPTKQLNSKKGKDPDLIFSWNQTLSRLKDIQQREQGIQNREIFFNNLLINKDNKIKTLSDQLQRFQIEKNNIFAQQQQFQTRKTNLMTQLQQSQTEIINLTNRLQETQKEAQNSN